MGMTKPNPALTQTGANAPRVNGLAIGYERCFRVKPAPAGYANVMRDKKGHTHDNKNTE